MKNVSLTLFIPLVAISICNHSFSQPPNIQWAKCYGGTGDDQSWCIKQTPDSGFIIGGSSNLANGDVTSNFGDWDVWLVKTDGAGTIQWQKSYGGTLADKLRSIAMTSDGGYVFACEAYSNDSDVIGNHGLTTSDAWIVKLNSTGVIQWAHCFGYTGLDYPASIIQTIDGGYILAGTTDSVTSNHGNGDYWLLKLDSMGLMQWEKIFGSSGNEVCRSVRQTPDGGYIVAGSTSIGFNDGDVTGPHGFGDYWILKLDAAGSLVWEKCFGGTVGDVGYNAEVTADGDTFCER